MKKSSILVTLFLVVALVFAVSCPSGVAVSITGTNDISKNATVGEALEAFTFEISTTGEFLSTAVDQELTIKGLDNFSGSGDSEKATATAKIKTLGAADATSKKITTATVEVSGFTAKVATNEAKELTFAIPAVKSGETAKILKDVTTEVAISGKKVLIVASKPIKYVIITPNDVAMLEFTAGSSSSSSVEFTIESQGAKWKENATYPTLPEDNGLSFSFVRESDTVLRFKVTETTATNAGTKTYSFDITDQIIDITAGSELVIPSNFKKSVTVQVNPKNANISGKSGNISFTKGIADTTGKDLTITFNGAKVKAGISVDTPISFTTQLPTGVSAKFKEPTEGASTLTITFTADGTTTAFDNSVDIVLNDYLEPAGINYKIPSDFKTFVNIKIS